MAKNLISGLYSTEFYQLLEQSLLARGYASLEEWIAENPNYWFDEEAWKSIYTLAPFENPARTFEQKIGERSVPIMATYLSDEAEGPMLPTAGVSKKTGEIPRMGRGVAFDIDAYEKMQMLARQGVNVQDAYYDQFVKDTMNLIQSIHSQRSFTGFQVESKGSYVTTLATSNGGIVGYEINLNPLAENRKKCGGFWLGNFKHGTKNAWSSGSAKPLGDLEDMFNYGWRMRIIPRDPKASVFRMSASEWEVLRPTVPSTPMSSPTPTSRTTSPTRDCPQSRWSPTMASAPCSTPRRRSSRRSRPRLSTPTPSSCVLPVSSVRFSGSVRTTSSLPQTPRLCTPRAALWPSARIAARRA